MVLRYTSSLAGAASMTFSLFFLMTLLVAVKDVPDIDPKRPPVINMLQDIIDIPPVSDRSLPPKPVPVDLPPEDIGPILDPVPGATPISYTPAPTGVGHDERISRNFDSGGLVILVMAHPIYPPRAIERELEGYAVVEFTVTSVGNVVDARVVDADPPGVFDRAAIQAIEKSKFKPQVVDGRAIETKNQRYRFVFALDD